MREGAVGWLIESFGYLWQHNTMMQIKENVQSLRSALRRKKGDSTIEKSVAEYNLFSKKMKMNARKSVMSLKNLETKFGTPPLFTQDQDLAAVIVVLREVIVLNMSIFQSLLSFLAGPASKSKASKWMSKLMHKGVISCEENSNEWQCVGAALSTLLNEGANAYKMQAVHERLEALENIIESFDSGLENLFRRLIKTRASLLNTMTQ